MIPDLSDCILFPVVVFVGEPGKQKTINFIVDTAATQTAVPKELITNTKVQIGTRNMQDASAQIHETALFQQTLRANTRDDGAITLEDFPVAESKTGYPLLGTDFLHLFHFRITDNKLYLIALRGT